VAEITTIAQFVKVIEVTDLEGVQQELEIWFDPEAKGLFAVESSFLDQTSDTVRSPYNKDTALVLPAKHLEGKGCRRNPVGA